MSISNATVTYNGSGQIIPGSGTQSGDTILYSADGVTYSSSFSGFTNAGPHTVYAKVQRDNYNDWTGSAILTISPLQLTIADPTAAGKVYDGTTAADVTAGALTNLISGDDVAVTAAGTFTDANVGNGITVSVTYTISGADAGNYIAPADGTAFANITNATITGVAVTGASVVYDGTAYSVTVTGNEAADTILYSADGETYSADLPAYINAGTYTTYVKVQRTNYNDWTGSATIEITQRQLTISGTTVTDKIYDGTATANVNKGTLGNVVSGDEIEVSAAGTYADSNVGIWDVAITYTISGAKAANRLPKRWNGARRCKSGSRMAASTIRRSGRISGSGSPLTKKR